MKHHDAEQNIPPGGYILSDTAITFNEERPVTLLKIRNTGDRPIQIGSHFHFFEVNKSLHFDRAAAFGKRLNIAAATSVRFEPGDETQVALIPFGGKQRIGGFNNLADGLTDEGPVDDGESTQKKQAIQRAKERGFISEGADN